MLFLNKASWLGDDASRPCSCWGTWRPCRTGFSWCFTLYVTFSWCGVTRILLFHILTFHVFWCVVWIVIVNWCVGFSSWLHQKLSVPSVHLAIRCLKDIRPWMFRKSCYLGWIPWALLPLSPVWRFWSALVLWLKYSFCFCCLFSSVCCTVLGTVSGFNICGVVGSLVLTRLPINSWANDAPMSSIDVLLSKDRWGSFPSDLAFFSICFTVCTPLSAVPFDCAWWGLVVLSKNSHSLAKAWNSRELNCGPLSEITVSGIPCLANCDLRWVITLALLVSDFSHSTSMNLE